MYFLFGAGACVCTFFRRAGVCTVSFKKNCVDAGAYMLVLAGVYMLVLVCTFILVLVLVLMCEY